MFQYRLVGVWLGDPDEDDILHDFEACSDEEAEIKAMKWMEDVYEPDETALYYLIRYQKVGKIQVEEANQPYYHTQFHRLGGFSQ